MWRNNHFGHLSSPSSSMISLGRIHKCLLPTLSFLLLCFPECYIHILLYNHYNLSIYLSIYLINIIYWYIDIYNQYNLLYNHYTMLPFVIIIHCHPHWALSASKNNNNDSLYLSSRCYVPSTLLNALYALINLVLNRILLLSPSCRWEKKTTGQ